MTPFHRRSQQTVNIFQVGSSWTTFNFSQIIRDLKNKTTDQRKQMFFVFFLPGDEMLEITSVS